MEALKKFALNSTTSSLAERRKLFEDIFAAFGSDSTRNGSLTHTSHMALSNLIDDY